MATVTVLIVDDHAGFRKTLREWLEAVLPGLTSREATSGEECLALAGDLRPDVVLMDIGLPGISGLETTREVLVERPATKIVIISMHDTGLLRAAAAGVGAVGFVAKSDLTTSLRPLLQTLLASPPDTAPAGVNAAW